MAIFRIIMLIMRNRYFFWKMTKSLAPAARRRLDAFVEDESLPQLGILGDRRLDQSPHPAVQPGIEHHVHSSSL